MLFFPIISINWWLVYSERKIAVNKWNKRPQSKKDDETWQDKQITEKFKGKSAPHWYKAIKFLLFDRQEKTGSRFPHATAHSPALPGATIFREGQQFRDL